VEVPSLPITLLAIDPGSEKCGYALLLAERERTTVLQAGIENSSEIGQTTKNLVDQYPSISIIAIGNGTNSKQTKKLIQDLAPQINIEIVDEKGTSEKARKLYLERNPAQGLEKMLPNGLRSPKKPYDDIVAELIGINFIASWYKNLQQ
jgi:RNase H-fold protein (predicted Holliday junction resolvase)